MHCGSDTLKDLHHHVDGIPDMSKFSFDDVNKCATCLQAKNHKHGPGHGSLRDTATIPYQGLYIDFAHAGQVKYDEDGVVDESSRSEIEGLNGERSWILISDAHTRMLHGDTRRSKATPLKYLRSWLNQYASKTSKEVGGFGSRRRTFWQP